jgi:Zn-dependent protease with chaperone function
MVSALEYFTQDEIARARTYHRPLYVVWIVGAAINFALLALLAFGPPGDWIGDWLDGLPFWAEALAWPAVVIALGWLIGLPLSYWRGFVHEKAWGFSTQTRRGWFVDRVKGLAVGLVITSGMVFGFVAVARALPDSWPAVVAPGAALVVLVLSFVAPVLLEPIFNKFRPLADEALADDLRALSVRAGVPVRDVLVADASRRTRKENAYVSGLGSTRRVVLYDTLVARDQPDYVRLVVAHELGHRRMRHVAIGTAVGMAGAAGAVLVLWALLSWGALLDAIGASGPGDPRVTPFLMLAVGVLEFVGMPFLSAFSRYLETAADRFSLQVGGDLEVFESSHRSLAVANLSDLDPPRAVYLMVFSHPKAPERIAAARTWSEEGPIKAG